ncbi:MAG: DUF4294 domain-containing protein [Prevotellaceae bacterium]|nr:DUF4294 domain-containing protein [Prevotellaceae bacterium]
MRLRLVLCFSACLLALSWEACAQDWTDYLLDNEELAPARNQTWYWAGKKYIYEGEAIWTILMPELPVYKPLRFKSKKEQERYNKLVYNVKRVLPLAQQVNSIIQETYLVLEQLPDKKSKEAHIKMIEKELMTRYKPEMKKLTYAQGKLLIKLVDRECNQSGYDVVKAFLGPTRATFYQVFAWTFHASLKKEFDAEGDDRLIERICRQVEAGTL